MSVLTLSASGRVALETGTLSVHELALLADCVIPTDRRRFQHPQRQALIRELVDAGHLEESPGGHIMRRVDHSSDELAVVFAGRPDPPAKPTTHGLPGMHEPATYSPFAFVSAARLLERNLLLFVDYSWDDYRRFSAPDVGDFASLTALLDWIVEWRANLSHVSRVVCFGVCSGAGPAVIAGQRLGADLVVSLGLLARDVIDVRAAWVPADPMVTFHLYPGASEVRLYYSEGNVRDRETSESLRDLPGAKLYPRPGTRHLVGRTLWERGEVPTLLDRET